MTKFEDIVQAGRDIVSRIPNETNSHEMEQTQPTKETMSKRRIIIFICGEAVKICAFGIAPANLLAALVLFAAGCIVVGIAVFSKTL